MITSNQQAAAYDLIQANMPPLEARAVGYTIARRHLVGKVSLALRPGELLARHLGMAIDQRQRLAALLRRGQDDSEGVSG